LTGRHPLTFALVRFKLVPTDDRFFDLFSSAAENVAESARRLQDLFSKFDDLPGRHKQIIECEQIGDGITDEILNRLNTTFVTPFDREDIHALAEELDDVVDDVMAVSHRLQLTGISTPLPESQRQADILVKMADETVLLMSRLKSMKNVQPHLEAIDELESEGDTLYRATQARLFSGEFEALDVMRYKDVVEAMEDALNALEDVSNVVESIVVKYA
jgi:predicted phosphate transport protein (TIGR00153 family)